MAVAFGIAPLAVLTAEPPDAAAAAREGLSPSEELTSFHLADSELEIELVAAEPVVASPVAIAWDADGRLFVAEMIGYPATENTCRIALLEDRDGDGSYERTSTFADNLSFVTSVMPYRGGLLATVAPDVLFLKDTDGDNQADVCRVEYTGFGTGSQQLRANSLHWGLDNWIYGANGRCDGDVRRPEAPVESAVSLRTRDFRFHPVSGTFQAIAGQSQFGQAHDDWGNRFLSWNTIPARQVIVDDRYLASASNRMFDVVIDLTEPGDVGRVFPVSLPPRQFNTEQANYYNALCGLTIYRGNQLGPCYAGGAFICESLTNLVTRRVLEPSGPAFIGRRAENERDREFLASTDSWFHPVNLANGPDGALYVVDFYREFVEHPIYVADEQIRNATDWRHGAERGRIWRIRKKGSAARQCQTRQHSRANANELVALLEHPVGWQRDSAQRLLVERQDANAVVPLQDLAMRSKSPLARLHALWTLEGLKALNETTLLTAIGDAHPGVRRHAVQLAESRIQASAKVADAVLALVNDADLSVRFQVTLTLGLTTIPQSPEAISALVDQANDPWTTFAALCASDRAAWPVLRQLLQRHEWNESVDVEQARFLEQMAMKLTTQPVASDIDDCLTWLASAPRSANSSARIAVLAGLSKELTGEQAERLLGVSTSPALQAEAAPSTRGIPALLRLAGRAATQVELDFQLRLQAIELLARFRTPVAESILLELLQAPHPSTVQAAAARSLAEWGDADCCRSVYRRWPQLGVAAREETIASALRTSAATTALLDAIDDETVLTSELPVAARIALAEVQDVALKQMVERLLTDTALVDRAAVVARYREAAQMSGDARLGAMHVQKHCLTCHSVLGVGGRVGPDLSSVGSRNSELLLVDILDPSRNVSADFLNYFVHTQQGKTFTGLIVAESADAITLLSANGERETIARRSIEELRSTGKSIMPDGIEEELSPQQLADVLAFLRRPDRALLPAAAKHDESNHPE